MSVVGRFQVMATLQAARAFLLGFSLESAKSWGLNRAIFYAAAKRGFKKIPPLEKITVPTLKGKIEPALREQIAVEINGVTYFLIGDRVQTPEDFARQIESRFRGKFDQAWKQALEHCRKYDQAILKSQRYFYEMVYKPFRDKFAQEWTTLSSH